MTSKVIVAMCLPWDATHNAGQIMNQKRVRLSLKKRITFSVCVTLAFFCFAEIGFRALEIFWPPRHVDFGLGFNDDSRIFVDSSLHPGYMETAPVKRVSFVRQRFLRDKPAGVFRIVALGGSSVNYLEPEFRKLERDLSTEFDQFDQIEIINCGGLAYGSHRLVFVMREMLEYQPDLILLYAGHNEFEEIEQLSLSGLNHLSFERTISNSAMIRFIRDRKTDYEHNRLEKEHNQRVLSREEPVSDSNFARAWSYEFGDQDVQDRMQSYTHNLSLILTTARNQQVPVIMGTVSSNLLRPYLPRDAALRYEQVYESWKAGSAEEGLDLPNRFWPKQLDDISAATWKITSCESWPKSFHSPSLMSKRWSLTRNHTESPAKHFLMTTAISTPRVGPSG